MQVYVFSSVCLMKSCLELSIFILEQSGLVSGQSQVSLRSVLCLEALVTLFVVQSKPKILHLVHRLLYFFIPG